jgi:hypothetical protein
MAFTFLYGTVLDYKKIELIKLGAFTCIIFAILAASNFFKKSQNGQKGKLYWHVRTFLQFRVLRVLCLM